MENTRKQKVDIGQEIQAIPDLTITNSSACSRKGKDRVFAIAPLT